MGARGYVLIDGSNLQGPLGPFRAGTRSSMPCHSMPCQWFEVVKSMVFVTKAPCKDTKSLGLVRQGQRIKVKMNRVQDAGGYQWVELESEQMRRLEGVRHDARGFCLIDGSHLGLGPLLRGPIDPPTPDEEVLWRTNEEAFEKKWAQERAQEVEDLQRKRSVEVRLRQKEDEGRHRHEALQKWRNEANNDKDHEETLRGRAGTVVYRTVHEAIFQKDNASGEIKKKPCRRGDCVYTIGSESKGDGGALWVKSARNASSSFLVQGPGFGIDGPLLLNEAATLDHIRVSVLYDANIGEFRIFNAFVPESMPIRSLKFQVSEQTQLKAKGIMLLRRKEVRGANAPDSLIGIPEVLADDRTLQSYGFRRQVQLYVAYNYDFVADYLGGC